MNSITIIVSIFLLTILGCNGQTASTVPTTNEPTTPAPLDAYAGGKYGNPGAQLRFSEKALDAVLTHAVEMIAKTIKAMEIPNVMVPLANGILSIKNARVTEVKIGGHDRKLAPPNRIRTRFYNARLASIGEWSWKPLNGDQRSRNMGSSGLFRTIVVNAEINMTTQVGQAWPGKPRVDVMDCTSYLGQFRVEIEGFGENGTVIDQCDNTLCKRIRQYFQGCVCNSAKSYVNNFINRKLSTIPTRVNLGSSGGNRFVMDYGLLLNEPKVGEDHIQGHLEGKVLSRGSGVAPFHASTLSDFDDETGAGSSMMTFRLSDHAFNTLFHHAHTQQFKFSAFDMVPASSTTRDYLKIRCSDMRSAGGKTRSNAQRNGVRTNNCLGGLFENVTLSDGVDGLGDVVLKTQRAFQVIINSAPVLGVDGGVLEIYGAAGEDGKRELLGRADVRSVRASFLPKLSGCNITGDLVIYSIQLAPSAAVASVRQRSLPDVSIPKLATLAVPIFTDVFRTFLSEYAQFPVPLFEGLECLTPELKIDARTIQLRSEIKVLPEATRISVNRKA